jgi:hypothetical protein
MIPSEKEGSLDSLIFVADNEAIAGPGFVGKAVNLSLQ